MNKFFALALTLFVFQAQAEKLQILNEDAQPLAGADVIVGRAINDPIANNKLQTDMNGYVEVPDDWKATELPITVIAEGYLRSTFMPADNRGESLQVHRADARTQIEVKGQATNFQGLKKDGKVDFGLVYPALKRRALAQFDVGAMISPEVDEIKVISETLAVPSNLTLPEQKESYVLPITLDKPDYRMYFKQPGQYRMMAMHGQFPLKQVVNDLRDGKAFYEVINYFNFLGGGQRDLTINNNQTGQDIPVNQIPFDKKISVKAPALAADQVMLSVSMVDQAGLFFPTDLKNVTGKTPVNLSIPAGSNQNYIVSLLMPKLEAQKIGGVRPSKMEIIQSPGLGVKMLFDQFIRFFGGKDKTLNDGPGGLSVSLNPETVTEHQFLGLIGRPTVDATGGIVSLQVPTIPEGLEPVATYLVLSEIERRDVGQYELERRYRQWEIYQTGWTKEVRLPSTNQALDPAKNYRWEVLFMARPTGHNGSEGYYLDGVTHVSRNSFDF